MGLNKRNKKIAEMRGRPVKKNGFRKFGRNEKSDRRLKIIKQEGDNFHIETRFTPDDYIGGAKKIVPQCSGGDVPRAA